MNEQDFVRSVRRHLDAGLDAVTPAVLYRLRAAREAALARAEKGPAARDATAATSVLRPQGQMFTRRLLAPVGAVLVIAGVLFWQQYQQHGGPSRPVDYADVDTEVLTDDLPVVAYLDPGFEIWLYHHSPASVAD
jgi:Protein of unknown function (DUF3619)